VSASGPVCPHCGSSVPPAARFCPNCGAGLGDAATAAVAGRPPAPDRVGEGPVRSTSGKAIGALVLAIGGFLLFPVVCSVAAILVGRMAQREIDEDPLLAGRGLATAGIVLGWIEIGFVVLGLVLFLFA
jgi:Domain of unknown function (DUF4190)/zinc-ribbon domain